MPLPPDHICEARKFGELMYCGRCEIHGFAPETKVLPCKASSGLTPTVFRAEIEAAANDIGASIDAAFRVSQGVSAGAGHPPHPTLLRREAALRAALRYIDHQQKGKGA